MRERTVEIRPARSDDAERIAMLLTELGYPTRPDAVGPRLASLSSTDDAVVVAVSDGRVVGLLTLHLRMNLQFDEPFCYITTLVTDAEVRGEGFGKLLLAEAERWARERRCNRITVMSANHRTGAHAFYEGHGYDHTGRRFVKLLGNAD